MAARRDSGVHHTSGDRFAVTSGCAEASEAALQCLQGGGNVFDAALVASAVTCVVLPHATTIGGDFFALMKRASSPAVASINATGAAPMGASIAAYRERGHRFAPERGGLSAQGPGLPAGWQELADHWCSRPLAELLEPAIALARQGPLVGWRLARALDLFAPQLIDLPGFAELFAPGGRMLAEGDRFAQEKLAATLASIAAGGARAFYEGPIARDIAASVQAAGGFLAEADMPHIRATLEPPLATRFRGLDIYTQPPISQGMVLLRALKLLEDQLDAAPSDAARWRAAAKAIDTAFDERRALLGEGPLARQLAQDVIDGRAPSPGGFAHARAADNTSALSVMDAEGDCISVIQSVFSELGSGVIGRETGVLMNNRMSGFFLDPTHPNALAPGRRTMHTLHSFMAVDAKGVRWAGGSPGADAQPQVNLQVLTRLAAFGEDAADAIDAPRWVLAPGTQERELAAMPKREIELEAGFDAEIADALAADGWKLRVNPNARTGSSKIVGRDGSGVGAWADWRREGSTAAG